MSPTYHVRLKMSGSAIKRVFFDFIMSQVDIDYPFRPECVMKYATHSRKTNPPPCETCGGRSWVNPLWEAVHLKKLARQVNSFRELPGQFGLRVKRFEEEKHCPVKKTGTQPPANQTPTVSQPAIVTVGETI